MTKSHHHHHHLPPACGRATRALVICNLLFVIFLGFGICNLGFSATTDLASPDGNLIIRVSDTTAAHLTYEVLYKNTPVISPSRMGVTIDNTDAGANATIAATKPYTENTTYPWNGIHSKILNHYNALKITLNHPTLKNLTLDIRAYDDGVAFAFTAPAPTPTTQRAVQGELTEFRLTPGDTLWYHDFRGHYEGFHTRNLIEDVKEGQWMAPPITVKLANGLGYLSLNEAYIHNYSGMGFQAAGNNTLRVRLAHEQPAAGTFVNRYGKDQADRLAQPPIITGDIATPWRVIAVAPNLNTLVNTDLHYNLSPDPDKTYFPDGRFAPWLQPGRALWGYLTKVPRTIDGMKLISKQASELGFEYQVVEGHWMRWTDQQQKDFIDYSKKLGVKILLWENSQSLWNLEKRRAFFQHVADVGAAGAKIDFFDHEAKEIEDLYLSCLKLAARHHLVLVFHGASKPTGESKTWPNELSREAIRGLEMRGPWSTHNVTAPFTRLVAGPADYTPLHFGDRKADTTDTHQIATAIILSAPLLIYAAEPADLLQHPATNIIRQIPSTWDETRVLEPSAIGEVAIYARRKGDTWFLAALNGPDPRTITINLSFLGSARYTATLIRDKVPTETLVSFAAKRLSYGSKSGVAIDTLPPDTMNDTIIVELLPAGGFVAMFQKAPQEDQE